MKLKMRKLVLVRHGEFDHEQVSLTEAGQEGMRRLAELLRPHVKTEFLRKRGGIRIVTSTALRAVQSGQVLAKELGLHPPSQKSEFLWSDDDQPHENGKILRLIKEWGEFPAVVILITHFEIVRDIPPLFGRRVLRVKSIKTVELERSTSRLINCVTKKAIVIG